MPGEIAEGWKAVLTALGMGALNGGLSQWEHEKQWAMQSACQVGRGSAGALD